METTTPTNQLLRLVDPPLVTYLRVRSARVSDLAPLDAMVERSSADTLYRRFHGPFGDTAKKELRRMVRPTPDHRSWVAVAKGGVRGTATLAFGVDGTAEVAILVEDDWQHSGVGRALLNAVLDEAAHLRLLTLVAYVQGENWRARSFFLSVAPAAVASFEDREVTVRIPVAASVAARLETPRSVRQVS